MLARLFTPQDNFTMSDFSPIRRQLIDRLTPLESLRIEPERIPQAAVTLILREETGAAEMLIIKRAERAGDPWSGHLALPGGRAQAEDADLLATAARETYEEIGVDLLDPDGSWSRFIGRLPLIVPNNPLLPKIEITPLVAIAPPSLSTRLSHEVEAIWWVPVGKLKSEGLSQTYSMRFGEIMRKWPAYPTEAGLVWGITERILTNFLSLLD